MEECKSKSKTKFLRWLKLLLRWRLTNQKEKYN